MVDCHAEDGKMEKGPYVLERELEFCSKWDKALRYLEVPPLKSTFSWVIEILSLEMVNKKPKDWFMLHHINIRDRELD